MPIGATGSSAELGADAALPNEKAGVDFCSLSFPAVEAAKPPIRLSKDGAVLLGSLSPFSSSPGAGSAFVPLGAGSNEVCSGAGLVAFDSARDDAELVALGAKAKPCGNRLVGSLILFSSSVDGPSSVSSPSSPSSSRPIRPDLACERDVFSTPCRSEERERLEPPLKSSRTMNLSLAVSCDGTGAAACRSARSRLAAEAPFADMPIRALDIGFAGSL